MSSKIPSDCPKFDGKSKEDPQVHVMTYHLLCSSNLYVDDSIRLRLFQCMLTRDAAKWYVDQPAASHSIFVTLAKTFLSYFQLPLQYDTGMKLLTSFCQSSTTRLSDHVQEWCWRRSTCRAPPFKDRAYLDWFLKSLLSPIEKDVTSHFPQTEEEALQTALIYDLIYAQSGYVYTAILDIPCPGSANAPRESHVVDGIFGSLSHSSPYT